MFLEITSTGRTLQELDWERNMWKTQATWDFIWRFEGFFHVLLTTTQPTNRGYCPTGFYNYLAFIDFFPFHVIKTLKNRLNSLN